MDAEDTTLLRNLARFRLGCEAPLWPISKTDPSITAQFAREAQNWTGTPAEVFQVYMGRPSHFNYKTSDDSTLAIVFHFGYVDILLAFRNLLVKALAGEERLLMADSEQFCFRILANEALHRGQVDRAVKLFCRAMTGKALLEYKAGGWLDLQDAPIEEKTLCCWMFGLGHEFGHHPDRAFGQELRTYLRPVTAKFAQELLARYADLASDLSDLVTEDILLSIVNEHIADVHGALITWNVCGDVMHERLKRSPAPDIIGMELLIAQAVLLLTLQMRSIIPGGNDRAQLFAAYLRLVLIQFAVLEGNGPLRDMFRREKQPYPAFQPEKYKGLLNRLLDLIGPAQQGIRAARATVTDEWDQTTDVMAELDQFFAWKQTLTSAADRDAVGYAVTIFCLLARDLRRSSPALTRLWDDVSTRNKIQPGSIPVSDEVLRIFSDFDGEAWNRLSQNEREAAQRIITEHLSKGRGAS